MPLLIGVAAAITIVIKGLADNAVRRDREGIEHEASMHELELEDRRSKIDLLEKMTANNLELLHTQQGVIAKQQITIDKMQRRIEEMSEELDGLHKKNRELIQGNQELATKLERCLSKLTGLD